METIIEAKPKPVYDLITSELEPLNEEAERAILDALNSDVQEVNAVTNESQAKDAIKKDLIEAGEPVKETPFDSFTGKSDTPEPSASDSIKKLANPDVVITLFDSIVKRLMPMTTKLAGLEGTTPDYWALSSAEKAELKPALKEFINTSNIGTISPGVTLLVCVLIIYGFKFMVAMDISKDSKKGKPENKDLFPGFISGDDLIRSSPIHFKDGIKKDGTPAKKRGPKGPRMPGLPKTDYAPYTTL